MNTNALADMETLFTALADKTRLRLLNLMRRTEVCVCFFTEVLGESQPKISRHLAYLRNAGLVEARRDGKWMHYRIVLPDDDGARRVIESSLDWIESLAISRMDRQKFDNVCCTPELLVQIARTPIDFIEQAEVKLSPGSGHTAVGKASAHNELEEFLL